MNIRAISTIIYLMLLTFNFASGQKFDSTIFFVENFTFEKSNDLSKKMAVDELRKRNWSEEYVDQIIKSFEDNVEKRKKKWQYPHRTLEALKKMGLQCKLIEVGDSSYKTLVYPKIYIIRYSYTMHFFKRGGFAIILNEMLYDKHGTTLFSTDQKISRRN
jgi:hypothetical protein